MIIVAIFILALFQVAMTYVICTRQDKMQKKIDSYDEIRRTDQEWFKNELSKFQTKLNEKYDTFDSEMDAIIARKREKFSEYLSQKSESTSNDIEASLLDATEKTESLISKVSMKTDNVSKDFKILKIFLKTNTYRDNHEFMQKVQESFSANGVAKVECEEDEDDDTFIVKYESEVPFYFHVDYDFDNDIMYFGSFKVGTVVPNDRNKLMKMDFEES